jgi:hypothetical protein
MAPPREKRAVLRLVNAFLRADYHRIESLSDCVFVAQALHAVSAAGPGPVFPLSRIDLDPRDGAARARNAELCAAWAPRVHPGGCRYIYYYYIYIYFLFLG